VTVAATAPPGPTIAPPRSFLAPWGTRPVVTVELDVPKGLAIASTLARAKVLAAAGVDAINLAENPLARIRMGNLALASRLQTETGVDVIVHVTGRDRNLIGLHSELMGAHLLGIRNVLAVTGDPLATGGETGGSNVFDLNSVGLLTLLNALNHGRNLFGAELGETTRFVAGCAFNPNVADLSGQLHKLEKKLAAGARFVQTQPVFDPIILERLLTATRPFAVPVLLGLMPLVGERNAEFLHNEVPGIVLPEAVRRRMQGTNGAAGVREGMAICRELVLAARGQGVGGYYLIPPFGRVELALELLEVIRGTG
jgi:homocysteine S-methyltransferase